MREVPEAQGAISAPDETVGEAAFQDENPSLYDKQDKGVIYDDRHILQIQFDLTLLRLHFVGWNLAQ